MDFDFLGSTWPWSAGWRARPRAPGRRGPQSTAAEDMSSAAVARVRHHITKEMCSLKLILRSSPCK